MEEYVWAYKCPLCDRYLSLGKSQMTDMLDLPILFQAREIKGAHGFPKVYQDSKLPRNLFGKLKPLLIKLSELSAKMKSLMNYSPSLITHNCSISLLKSKGSVDSLINQNMITLTSKSNVISYD